ncbi:NEAT domain-containing protein [uncultured Clostridium sp.]|uniref:NEAT domain-containing protein n=1 Tax=uncultured Clostridium sp. TaxID=59620 RepID=UPI0025D93529|nr:NEAT domain-containing protein [uncultured Clostridium sp.]
MSIVKNIKKIMVGFLALMLTIGFSTLAYGSEDVKSGVYQVKNSVYHESELGMSMSRSYLDDTMLVKITKSEVVFTIGFSGTSYMNNYRIVIDGQEVPVEIVEENKDAGTIKVQVKAASKDVDMQAKIYVDPMGRDVEFSIIPDYENMTLVEAIEEEDNTEDANAEEANVEEVSNDEVEVTSLVEPRSVSKDNKDKSNSKTAVIVIGAIVVIAAGVTALKFKLKK